MTVGLDIATTAQDPIGLWDQWCVLSEEPYIKTVFVGGQAVEQQSLLNEANCRTILENFANQKDNLPCTLGHYSTTADKAKFKVAEYSALALFVGGQCVAMASHEDGLAQPTLDMLPRGDNGDAPEDGIYVYRKFLTDLGKACWSKQAVKKTSPEFLTEATDQHNRPIGPLAQGLAWTDSPFLDGCEIKFERGDEMVRRNLIDELKRLRPMAARAGYEPTSANLRAREREREIYRGLTPEERVLVDNESHNWETGMHKSFMEAGCMESDEPKVMSKKLFAHYGRTGMSKAGCMESDKAEDVVAKFAKSMEDADAMAMESGDADKDKGQEHKEPDKDNKVEMQSDPIVQKGAPTYIDQPGPNNKVVYEKTASQQTIEALSQQFQMEQKRRIEMERTVASLQAKEKRGEAEKAVNAAWGAGQIVPHPSEKDADARARFMRLYDKGADAFKDALAPVGTYATREQMGERLTMNHLPVNFERSTVEMEADRPDEEILRLIAEKRKSGAKGDTLKLARQVCMERPALGTAYRHQSKAALFA